MEWKSARERRKWLYKLKRLVVRCCCRRRRRRCNPCPVVAAPFRPAAHTNYSHWTFMGKRARVGQTNRPAAAVAPDGERHDHGRDRKQVFWGPGSGVAPKPNAGNCSLLSSSQQTNQPGQPASQWLLIKADEAKMAQ